MDNINELAKVENEYGADEIQVLEGLEAVRKRPGMYIGSTGEQGLHHLVYEIVDNAIDEALAGYCTKIEVSILPGDIIKVKDNGRGIPVGINKKMGLPAVTVVFTVLHAGGKFGGGGYKVSGGLHGVGASVVNALSEYLEVKVCDGKDIYFQRYERGKIMNDLEVIGHGTEKGTEVTFKPDPVMFTDTTVYKYEILDIEIDNNVFIPLNVINELKRKAFEELNNKRLYKISYKRCEYKRNVKSYPKEKLLNILIFKDEDIDSLKKKYDYIYSSNNIDNTILLLPRVIDKYKENYNKDVLVGDIGYFNKHKVCITDTSFNVVNSYTVAFLHSLGAERVTLSYELTKKQIEILINAYEERYKAHPNLELVVEGYEEVMISKFSLNKYINNDKLYLKDIFNNLYKIKEKDNLMIIYNYKKRKDFNLSYYDIGINSLRINKEE